MRRAQSTRHHPRPSLALAADDLGVLREGDESNEDVLRRQLLEREREIDRLKLTEQTLRDQLARRPPAEEVQNLRQEFKDLELILQGTQRENEKCMADLERQKVREKMLERELTRLAGDNWQANLDIAPSPLPPSATLRGGVNLHQRSNTMGSLSRAVHSSSPVSIRGGSSDSPTGSFTQPQHRSSQSQSQSRNSPLDENSLEDARLEQEKQEQHRAAQIAHLEQLKMLISGMEQRLESREEKLVKTVERAENEGKRYEIAVQNARGQGVGVGA